MVCFIGEQHLDLSFAVSGLSVARRVAVSHESSFSRVRFGNEQSTTTYDHIEGIYLHCAAALAIDSSGKAIVPLSNNSHSDPIFR